MQTIPQTSTAFSGERLFSEIDRSELEDIVTDVMIEFQIELDDNFSNNYSNFNYDEDEIFRHEFIEGALAETEGYVRIRSPKILHTTKKGSRKLHQKLVEEVFKGWKSNGYTHVEKEKRYSVDGVTGEFDIKGVIPEGILHYGEVKSEEDEVLLLKGLWQGVKSITTHPNEIIRMAIYNPQITRLYDHHVLQTLEARILQRVPDMEYHTCPIYILDDKKDYDFLSR